MIKHYRYATSYTVNNQNTYDSVGLEAGEKAECWQPGELLHTLMAPICLQAILQKQINWLKHVVIIRRIILGILQLVSV